MMWAVVWCADLAALSPVLVIPASSGAAERFLETSPAST